MGAPSVVGHAGRLAVLGDDLPVGVEHFDVHRLQLASELNPLGPLVKQILVVIVVDRLNAHREIVHVNGAAMGHDNYLTIKMGNLLHLIKPKLES